MKDTAFKVLIEPLLELKAEMKEADSNDNIVLIEPLLELKVKNTPNKNVLIEVLIEPLLELKVLHIRYNIDDNKF